MLITPCIQLESSNVFSMRQKPHEWLQKDDINVGIRLCCLESTEHLTLIDLLQRIMSVQDTTYHRTTSGMRSKLVASGSRCSASVRESAEIPMPCRACTIWYTGGPCLKSSHGMTVPPYDTRTTGAIDRTAARNADGNRGYDFVPHTKICDVTIPA